MQTNWAVFEDQIAGTQVGSIGILDTGDDSGFIRVCGCPSCGFKSGHGTEKIGDGGPVFAGGGDIAGDATTTTALTVGSSLTSDIGTVSDTDWIRITLTAGQNYRFDLVGSGISPLSDPYLILRDTIGGALAFDDDGGGNNNSQLIFQASQTGTYFLEARAYSTQVGEYTLSATAIAAPPPPPPSFNPVDSIQTTLRVTGTPIIDVYFANAGDTFLDGTTTVTATAFTAAQRAAFTGVFSDISNMVNLTFRVTTDAAQADFKLHMADLASTTLLGYMFFPNGGVQNGAFNQPRTFFNDLGVNKGGLGYITFVHELGHGLGLAHPHDQGAGSNIMTGVTNSSSLGSFQLNQGVFTSMTYNDGWVSGPFGRVPSLGSGYGIQGGFMPLDIAALQQKYGANTSFNTVDNTYALLDVNAVGTYYSAIWDTAGTDTLFYGGSRNANLDLRAATLQYDAGGGGYVSYANGIHGGFVISNGVLIENAQSGSGNDTLTGNAANNLLIGNGGDDVFVLSAGVDTILGGAGSDAVSFVNWGSAVTIDFTTATTYTFGTTTFSDVEGAIGSSFDDVIFGTAGVNRIEGFAGNDILVGRGGNDIMATGTNTTFDYVYGGDGNDTIFGDTGAVDILLGDAGNDSINGWAGGTNYIYGGTGDNIMRGSASLNVFISEGFYDRIEGGNQSFYYRYANGSSLVYGNTGVDQFIGGSALSDDIVSAAGGDDFLFGGNGNDYLLGGDGNDVIIGQNGNDTLDGGTGINLIWANDVGSDEIYVQATQSATQVLEFFEAGGANDVVRIIGANFGSFAGFEALRNSIGTVVNNNILYNTSSGAQLYLNLGANQTAIWFQGVSAYSLTSADFVFGPPTLPLILPVFNSGVSDGLLT
jgi:serralysin